ncbi:carbamoyltransferase N-terminal domain-containing protein [Bradyrhizobium sp. CCBAU 25338]|uniref:carbamoyltransferase N-terminal domain-containing protein n=1 Tax=Bradyrhizobium sp. CCBAU 25338 TaxID=1641877 RepID=UPI002302B0EB|nr:carbamoyltransferase N-terminal domain-containing protein [Bradyrhizobium sp. CCBAU 25338]
MLTRFSRHNSLGLYYGTLTEYLGYQMTNDEYKVMGLSSYGSPDYLAKLLRPCGINYELDPESDKRSRDGETFTSDF